MSDSFFLASRVWHVAACGGDDTYEGSVDRPLRTISAAAVRANPGDTVRVHAGIYRERIDPPRGGTSDRERIIYEAADGEAVEIRGSEEVGDWLSVGGGVWQVEVGSDVFGGDNPFQELIRGDWFRDNGRPHHTGFVIWRGHWLREAATRECLSEGFWYAQVCGDRTAIHANFGLGADPNRELPEISVRRAVFYPSRTGIDYVTVRGFAMRHAATNWAPPTAEQVGLIGTNWSRGWVIDNNTISHSRCTGVTLGKYGDEFDNISANTAGGYVDTIRRAYERGWSRERVGGHVVRNNLIEHCEQAGIVGSLGAIFSEVSGNVIREIHMQRFFSGAEQAGIKFHAPIDTLIAGNHIYRCNCGIWLDWMTQGTRITGNLCHDNDLDQDLFVEVNHGPFVVDHNIFLSRIAIFSMSEGGAFVHNLIGGALLRINELGRETPWHPQSSVEIAGLAKTRGGDERYMNNLFSLPSALCAASSRLDRSRGVALDKRLPEEMDFPNTVSHNHLLNRPPELREEEGTWVLEWHGEAGAPAMVPAVGTETLGTTRITGLPYLDTTGATLRFDRDFTGAPQTPDRTPAGPFAIESLGGRRIPVFSHLPVGSAGRVAS